MIVFRTCACARASSLVRSLERQEGEQERVDYVFFFCLSVAPWLGSMRLCVLAGHISFSKVFIRYTL